MGAVVGVISATGGDFGPFRSVEESTISHLTMPATRTDVLSWYVTTSTLGSALGIEAAGHIASFLKRLRGSRQDITDVYHAMFWIYVAMGVLSMIFACLMSRKCESTEVQVKSNTERPRETDPLLISGIAREDTHEQNDGDPVQTPSANLQQPSKPQSWLAGYGSKARLRSYHRRLSVWS